MKLVAHGLTDIGVRRDHNEDALLVDPDCGFFAVCDGVGGAKAGEVASSMAIERLRRDRDGLQERLAELGESDSDEVVRLLMEQLDKSIDGASEDIYNRGLIDQSMAGMSTTAVALSIRGSRGSVAHVGDSRIYLLRDGDLYQLTEDHSLACELLRQGVLRQEDMKAFRYRNVIIRAVGQHPTVTVDTAAVDVLPGDLYLLCSDGLSDQVSDEGISEVLSANEPEVAARLLVDLSNAAGGKDNVTVVIVQAFGEPPASAVMATQEKIIALGRFFLFKDLSFAQSMRVLKIVREVRPKKGEVVIQQGETGGELFLVVSGNLQVSQDGIDLAGLGAGMHFGELALISDQIRSATVTATEDTILLRVEREEFLAVLREDSVVAAKLLWRFLQHTAERVKDLSTSYAHEVMKAHDDTP